MVVEAGSGREETRRCGSLTMQKKPWAQCATREGDDGGHPGLPLINVAICYGAGKALAKFYARGSTWRGGYLGTGVDGSYTNFGHHTHQGSLMEVEK